MNIFILDKDFERNAQYHVDKHVIKMPLEATQLLCSTYYYTGQDEYAEYKLTHKNHPCSVWTRESLSNWMWLRDYGRAICEEYTYRYYKTHFCEGVIDRMIIPDLTDIGLTKFVLCMPEIYKSEDTVESYRAYYNGDKRHLFNWKFRGIPEWVNEIN